MVKRGEVWLVNLDPTVDSEIKKTRPCVIVSPPEMHDHLRTVMVAPMTTGSKPCPVQDSNRVSGEKRAHLVGLGP
jgi:mRNA interferase MazF